MAAFAELATGFATTLCQYLAPEPVRRWTAGEQSRRLWLCPSRRAKLFFGHQNSLIRRLSGPQFCRSGMGCAAAGSTGTPARRPRRSRHFRSPPRGAAPGCARRGPSRCTCPPQPALLRRRESEGGSQTLSGKVREIASGLLFNTVFGTQTLRCPDSPAYSTLIVSPYWHHGVGRGAWVYVPVHSSPSVQLSWAPASTPTSVNLKKHGERVPTAKTALAAHTEKC